MTATESTDQMGNIGDQMTLEKSMALNSVEPGLYRITVKIDDKVSNQTLTRSTPFHGGIASHEVTSGSRYDP